MSCWWRWGDDDDVIRDDDDVIRDNDDVIRDNDEEMIISTTNHNN